MTARAAKLPPRAESLYEEAAALPESERRVLAERLLDSLEAEPESGVERVWAKEATLRLDEIQSGKSQPAPWAEARDRIFARG